MASRRKEKKQNNLKADVVTQNIDNLPPSGQDRIIKKIGDLVLNSNGLFTVSWTILLVIVPVIISNTKKSLLSGYFNFFNISLNHIDINSNRVSFISIFYYIASVVIVFSSLYYIKEIKRSVHRIAFYILLQLFMSLFLFYIVFFYGLDFLEIMYLIQDSSYIFAFGFAYLLVLIIIHPIYKDITKKETKTISPSKKNRSPNLSKFSKVSLLLVATIVYIILINFLITEIGRMTAIYQTKYEVLTITDTNSNVKNEYIIAAYKGEKAIVIDCEVFQTTPAEKPTINIYRSKGYRLIDFSNLPVRQITFTKYNITFK